MLEKIAREAMKERGFLPDFPQDAKSEAARLKSAKIPSGLPDRRGWLFVSIDNDDSRDLDQLTYAEGEKIYIAIADVDALVKKDDAIDRYAHHNTTSIYTPALVFPMLPEVCSYNLTSLNPSVDRSAIVVAMRVAKDGNFSLESVERALVRNQAKLAYNRVAEWLEKKVPLAGVSEEIQQQLLLQDSLAQRILGYRSGHGALEFDSIELQAIMEQQRAVRLQRQQINRAHQLIENFMIAANVGVTHFLTEGNLPSIRRIVRTPKRWDRIVALAKQLDTKLPPHPDVKALRKFLLKQKAEHPDHYVDLSLAIIKLIGKGEYVAEAPGGSSIHFDLALHDYAHTTAPNRRYPDLIMQRLLKAELLHQPVPYEQKELKAIAIRCTNKENDAKKVERRLIKCAIAEVLQGRVGEQFAAMVTGAGPKGTWVRLKDPPVEGRLTHGFEDLDVGDKIIVELIRVDAHNGHIDFRTVKS